MDAYFARQPILTRSNQIFGYELLFRPNPKINRSNVGAGVDGDKATTSVLNVVDWGGIERITNGSYAFVNFTEQLLCSEVPSMYPKEHLVVEVLEDVRITRAVLNALHALKDKGYIIAADDYEFKDSDRELLDLCDIVKVDVDGSTKAWRNLNRVVCSVDLGRCKVLAEKVETEQDYTRAKSMGCTLFQGFYFAKPKLVMEKTINPMKFNQILAMREVAKPGTDFAVLAGIIKRDIGLSTKTLRLINSAYYGLENEVKSITQAVVLLGANELRRWILHSSMNNICEEKPSELVTMSMVRARFCERAALKTRHKKDAEALFLTGLFSLLDSMTDTPLERCLSGMRIPKKTRAALLDNNEADRLVLDLIIAIENSRWNEVARLSERLGLSTEAVSDLYLEAIQWAQQFDAPGTKERSAHLAPQT